MNRSLFTKSQPTPFQRTRSLLYLTFTLAAGAMALAYYSDSRSGIHRWVIMPVLKATTDPETAQKLAVKLLESGLGPKDRGIDDQVLATTLFGKVISNPIGLAAGFDKQAEAIDGLLDLGFGFVEVGSVTPEPQPGNPQPRYFRLTEDEASINRFGFNSEGHKVILGRLRDRIRRWLLHSSPLAEMRVPISSSDDATQLTVEKLLATHPTSSPAFVDAAGIPRSLRKDRLLAVNLGKNKNSKEESVDDYVKGVERLGPYADMIVVNVSSPNTPGLRRLQRRGVLQDLLTSVVDARDKMLSATEQDSSIKQVKVPLLVKIAPDLTEEELHDVADAATNSGVDGIIVSNTTISRPNTLRSSEHVGETGGLSGPPVKPLALKALQTVYKRTQGAITIIGCGGIASGQDVLDFGKAGASAVELYTSFGYRGVGLPRQIKDELTGLLKAEGKTWKDVIGTGLDLSKLELRDERPQSGQELSSDEAFSKSIASVKEELNSLRSSIGSERDGSGPDDSVGSSSDKVPAHDDAYFTLLEKTHSALGLAFPTGGNTKSSWQEILGGESQGFNKSGSTTNKGEESKVQVGENPQTLPPASNKSPEKSTTSPSSSTRFSVADRSRVV
ncbi:hypothetical protein IE53DRAFT_383216 [Violaceomyces palustris]|uniref:Uncharacterized protein n=1 Tax=Violaceomyces palustris TaxID=1673888 RepID=A0ACD0P833_9BASI|nr:hypothetical protein IE53DRAFT_383216 [Violaceomyces palustris]